jgi:hypothetical protein
MGNLPESSTALLTSFPRILEDARAAESKLSNLVPFQALSSCLRNLSSRLPARISPSSHLSSDPCSKLKARRRDFDILKFVTF